MSDPAFEWDKRKSSENKRKHGVTFEEAKSAFLDENARVILDPAPGSKRDPNHLRTES